MSVIDLDVCPRCGGRIDEVFAKNEYGYQCDTCMYPYDEEDEYQMKLKEPQTDIEKIDVGSTIYRIIDNYIIELVVTSKGAKRITAERVVTDGGQKQYYIDIEQIDKTGEGHVIGSHLTYTGEPSLVDIIRQRHNDLTIAEQQRVIDDAVEKIKVANQKIKDNHETPFEYQQIEEEVVEE